MNSASGKKKKIEFHPRHIFQYNMGLTIFRAIFIFFLFSVTKKLEHALLKLNIRRENICYKLQPIEINPHNLKIIVLIL